MLTSEQQAVVDHLKSPSGTGYTLVDSVDGSGKTHLLVSIANAISHTNSIYICYNSSIAAEAKHKFPATTHCSTTHSLAHRAVVKPYKLRLGNFYYKSILEKVPYDKKQRIVDYIKSFCLSSYTSFDAYVASCPTEPLIATLSRKYLDLMQTGKIECCHEFYLKLFHLLLANGTLTYDPFDFIMLDEAGDLNEVTLAIFQLLPSPRKIAVGDQHQNIYQFNETINCFSVLNGQGALFHLTKSFRVAPDIASNVQRFCRRYLDPYMHFTGTPQSGEPQTFAYLTRTNSALIAHMITCINAKKQFGLVRNPDEIFKMALMVCYFKYQSFISVPSYSHLQSDIDDYYENIELYKPKSLLQFLSEEHSHDEPLLQAIKLVQRHGSQNIMNAYNVAKTCSKSSQNYILATGHSCKGLEFDEVHIADDLNASIRKVTSAPHFNPSAISDTDREALNIYYVTCTRARLRLINATEL